jgi:uncharacterized membrane protein
MPLATEVHMRPLALRCSLLSTVVIIGCVDDRALEPSGPTDPSLAKGRPSNGPALIQLPSLGSNSEAWGVDAAGTIIVGHSFDRAGRLYPVKWTMQNGAWTISILPNAPSTLAKAVNNAGDAVGYSNTPQGSRAVLWPSVGGSAVTLGCAEPGILQVWGISAAGQVVVGNQGAAAVWTPGSCRETLPALGGGGAGAHAVNANGTIIGGTSAPNAGSTNNVPVRWTGGPGARQIRQLDTRAGTVQGSNAVGDLAGSVKVSCSAAGGCDHAIVWYAAGGVNELSALTPLGESSVATAVNSAGEVAGYLTTGTRSTAYLWSQQLGVVQLPSNSRTAAARGVSDPRADGTRLVIGTVSVSGIRGAVWVVRNP